MGDYVTKISLIELFNRVRNEKENGKFTLEVHNTKMILKLSDKPVMNIKIISL